MSATLPRRFKYLILDECYPVLFTEATTHASRKRETDKVTSAGHGLITFNKETGELEVRCWGESVGLKVKANPQLDEHLIKRMFVETY